eukprot:m.26610 g.26610  ORF g.26610 m.26610 type:complete len:57 (-) comp38726_c0_seq1:297-467(-)
MRRTEPFLHSGRRLSPRLAAALQGWDRATQSIINLSLQVFRSASSFDLYQPLPSLF